MTEVLIRVMALPKMAQRGLAIALAVIAALIILLLVFTAIQALSDLRAGIDEGRYNLARFERLLAQKPVDDAKAAAQPDDNASSFLAGENIAVIQAGLQTRVNAIASAQNVIVASVGNTPVLAIDGVQYAGVRANIQGNLPSINNTLFQLETSLPPLIIREATIRATSAMQEDGSPLPVELAAEIVVYGAVNPKGVPPGPENAKP
jgi:general secretion pathway protein M